MLSDGVGGEPNAVRLGPDTRCRPTTVQRNRKDKDKATDRALSYFQPLTSWSVYVCRLCNYARFVRAEVLQHLRQQHCLAESPNSADSDEKMMIDVFMAIEFFPNIRGAVKKVQQEEMNKLAAAQEEDERVAETEMNCKINVIKGDAVDSAEKYSESMWIKSELDLDLGLPMDEDAAAEAVDQIEVGFS